MSCESISRHLWPQTTGFLFFPPLFSLPLAPAHLQRNLLCAAGPDTHTSGWWQKSIYAFATCQSRGKENMPLKAAGETRGRREVIYHLFVLSVQERAVERFNGIYPYCSFLRTSVNCIHTVAGRWRPLASRQGAVFSCGQRDRLYNQPICHFGPPGDIGIHLVHSPRLAERREGSFPTRGKVSFPVAMKCIHRRRGIPLSLPRVYSLKCCEKGDLFSFVRS